MVFGIDVVRVFRGDVAEQKDAELSCRDEFDASARTIECIGPVMYDECGAPHIGFWKTSANNQFKPTSQTTHDCFAFKRVNLSMF